MQLTTTPHNTPTTAKFYLKTWLWLYLATLLTYFPFIFNFIWGNHDWIWIKEGTPLLSGVFEGRFSQFILQTLLFEGSILPILTVITALTFFSAGTIILLKLWHIPPKSCPYILLSLYLVCTPYTLSWLYFSFITLSCLSWTCIVIFAYALLEYASQARHPYLNIGTAVILFTMALGGYPPIINLIGVIFFTLTLNDLCFKSLTATSIARKYYVHAATILTSLVLFSAILYLLQKNNLQYGTYNTAGISLSDIPEKISLCLKASIGQFFTTTSFISAPYKYFGLFLFLLSLCLLWIGLPKHPANILFFLLSSIGLVLSPTLTFFASENTNYVLYEPRIDFFGLPYIYIFATSVLLRAKDPLFRNLSLFILSALIFGNIKTISRAAKIWTQGFKAEMTFAERVLSRLEETTHFSPTKKYTFLQGGTLDFRSRFSTKDISAKHDVYTLTAPYISWHLPAKAYQFYYPQNFVSADFDIYWSYVDSHAVALTPGLIRYINKQARPWPDSFALYVAPGTIILTVTPDGSTYAQNWLEQQIKSISKQP